jgi:hypothetical protein
MTKDNDWVVRRFDFYGERVDVRVHRSDLADLEFFYGAFRHTGSHQSTLLVELTCSDWPSRGFFASLLAKDKLAKTVRVFSLPEGELLEHREYRGWSDEPSPLPPFTHSSLSERVAVTPGAVVRSVTGKIILLVGANYVGKTATAMAVCESGGQLISDSIAVFDSMTGESRTFEAPLGFRRASLRSRTEVLDRSDHRLTVSPDTGLVALIRPSDALGSRNAAGGRLDAVVVLRAGNSLSVHVENRRVRLPWFTRSRTFDGSRVLPRKTVVLTTTSNSSAANVALMALDVIDV